jgi:hypothetical protein
MFLGSVKQVEKQLRDLVPTVKGAALKIVKTICNLIKRDCLSVMTPVSGERLEMRKDIFDVVEKTHAVLHKVVGGKSLVEEGDVVHENESEQVAEEQTYGEASVESADTANQAPASCMRDSSESAPSLKVTSCQGTSTQHEDEKSVRANSLPSFHSSPMDNDETWMSPDMKDLPGSVAEDDEEVTQIFKEEDEYWV